MQTFLSSRITSIYKYIYNYIRTPNFKHIFTLIFFLFASKGLGFFRQVLIYQRMDALASDMFLAAFKIPSTLTTLLLSGTVMTSVLPILTKLDVEDKDTKNASDYLNLVLYSIIASILVVNLALLIFTEFFLRLTTSSDIWQSLDQAGLIGDYILISRILLISPLALALQSVWGTFLNMRKRFLVYSWAGIIYNLGTVAGLLIGGYNAYLQASIGMMLGILCTAGFFAVECVRAGLNIRVYSLDKFWEKLNFYKSELLATWKTFWPRILILNGVVIANLLINVTAQNPGQITYFDIGLSIQEIFLTVVSSIATVFFPDLARTLYEPHSTHFFWRKIRKYSLGVFGVGLVGVLLTWVGAPIVVWLFELLGRGQNSADYIILIARVSTVSLVFQSLNEIVTKYFYVRQRVWEPVVLSLSAFVSQVAGTLILIYLEFDAGVAVCLGLALNNLVLWFLATILMQRDKGRVDSKAIA